ncbi:hypothetical protein N7541_010029 [Penicillium brevicompactum]|uniref:Uncharacterized protein n=1 Tax=Penicillium brevicompactum TaxID=5074 RepID=A0A9W9QN32_PENBR|nr:hypothetical protein N7541_010029 [Penicillium brevicompactum]
MADEKKQNPFEAMGPPEAEAEPEPEPEHPPAYTAEQSTRSFSPSTQAGPSTSWPDQQLSQSPRPIAIPAIASSFDSPFIRAYPSILQTHKLPKESFLNFLDQLNKDMASSPPLQVLDATGGILNSVPILFPLHWIGNAVSGLANLGGQGMSKGRTDSSIKTANRDIFGPRGLKVEIAKLDALAHLAKIPILDSQGKINRQAPLLLQLQDEQLEPSDEQQAAELEVQRRIRILQPWIADLEFEILPWSSKSKLTRFNAALKKRNDPGESSRREMRRERRGRRERFGPNDAEASPEDTELFRKALWLIIREIELEERR